MPNRCGSPLRGRSGHPSRAISNRGRPPPRRARRRRTHDGGACGSPTRPAVGVARSVPADVSASAPRRSHGRAVPALDVAEPPLDLGGRVGLPVVARPCPSCCPAAPAGCRTRRSEELLALWFQPLSLVQSLSRHGNWSMPKPASSISAQPIFRLPLYSSQEAGIGPSYGLGFAAASPRLRRLRARFFRDAAAASALRARSAASLAAAAARSFAWYSAARCSADCTPVARPAARAGTSTSAWSTSTGLRGQALLLGFPVFAQVEAAGNAHGEQRDSGRAGAQPAPQPTHEVVPSSGARTRRGRRPRGAGSRAVSAPTLPVAADAPALADRRPPGDERSPTISPVRGRSWDTIAHSEADGKPTRPIVTCATQKNADITPL